MGLARRLRGDDGFTLMEVTVALVLSSIVVAALVGVFFAFSQNVGDATGKAEHQGDARSLISEIVVELRQAVTPGPNANAVESLSADRIAFSTIEIGDSDPIRVVYQREDCVEGECELWVRRYAPIDFADGEWTFDDTPFDESFLLSGVLNDSPLFTGSRWVGDPKVRQSVASCSGDCAFPLVMVNLRSRPPHTSEGARSVLEIQEEVRLRNG